MLTHRETRFLRGAVAFRAASKQQQAAGYIGELRGFIPYASESRQMLDANGQPFVERLAPGVFALSLANAGHVVLADVGHNDAATFARRGVNLTLSEAPAGLSYVALLPDTTVGRDLKANVGLGIIQGTSFEFELRTFNGKPTGEEWTQRAGIAVRTIRSAILHRVNPVTEPAYLDTTLATRSRAGSPAERKPAPAPASGYGADRETFLRIMSRQTFNTSGDNAA
jgi:HK97 family phage prohead protease